MAELTPITSPCELMSGPPELPRLMAASVWMASSMKVVWLVCTVRPRALTIPVVRLITQNNFNGLRAFDNVKVCEDVTPRINDEPGAGALDGHRVHKEIVLGGLGENVGNRGRCLTVDPDVDGFVGGETGVALGVRCGAARQGFHIAWLPRPKTCAGPIGSKNEHQRGKNDACTMGCVCCGHGSRPFLIHSIAIV